MGVVRREGSWRLEKQKGGVYEITNGNQVKMKIITSDYSPEGFVDERNDFSVPVREVESFSQTEDIFQNVASNNSGHGSFGLPQQSNVSGGTQSRLGLGDDDTEGLDLPPIGLGLVGYLGGAVLITQNGFDLQSLTFLLGVGLILIGLVVTAAAGLKYKSEGPAAAIEFLFTQDDDSSEEKEKTETVKKTPPAPDSLKNELYFQRANQHCEWCGERVDSPDVHHITPRAEGGPNEPQNLVVLCPNCHRKADRGTRSKSKLRYKVSN